MKKCLLYNYNVILLYNTNSILPAADVTQFSLSTHLFVDDEYAFVSQVYGRHRRLRYRESCSPFAI